MHIYSFPPINVMYKYKKDVNEKDYYTREKCDNLYLDILSSIPVGRDDKDITNTIRKIFKTNNCDAYYSLRELRHAYEKKMGPDITLRVIKDEIREDDVPYIRKSLFHYCFWTRENVFSALSLRNKVYYQLTMLRNALRMKYIK